MGVLNVSLVAMDRPVWTGQASIVVARTPAGELGILSGHEPLLALLVDGLLRIKQVDGQPLEAVVHGGFLSVTRDESGGDQVDILAETAELSSEINVERAQAALERILADGVVDKDEKSAEIRARTRLRAAMAAEQKSMHLG